MSIVAVSLHLVCLQDMRLLILSKLNIFLLGERERMLRKNSFQAGNAVLYLKEIKCPHDEIKAGGGGHWGHPKGLISRGYSKGMSDGQGKETGKR